MQGAAYFSEPANLTAVTCAAGGISILAGLALLLGFLTPAAGAMVSLGAVGWGLSWFPPPAWNPPSSLLPAVYVVVVAAAIVLLGPGALSIDARMFGRREIIIPQALRRDQ